MKPIKLIISLAVGYLLQSSDFLIDIVSKNGNLRLSIGLKPGGTIGKYFLNPTMNNQAQLS